MTTTILVGDCRELLKTLPDCSVQTCVTSPPYWGLRDYGHADQLGLEKTPQEYVANMVAVFREVRRVLRDDGTLWLNLGDSYLRKSLVGIPWMTAFALRDDGWYLRSDIIWAKPNPMPESVRDRPTKAHEYVFLMSKSERYRYDVDAVREPMAHPELARKQVASPNANRAGDYQAQSGRHDGGQHISGVGFRSNPDAGRNRRSVWAVTPKPFKGAHFATMPPGLVEPCILAGSAPGDVVLDPFSGAGTTGLVASQHGRDFIGIELNQEYAHMSERRIGGVK